MDSTKCLWPADQEAETRRGKSTIKRADLADTGCGIRRKIARGRNSRIRSAVSQARPLARGNTYMRASTAAGYVRRCDTPPAFRDSSNSQRLHRPNGVHLKSKAKSRIPVNTGANRPLVHPPNRRTRFVVAKLLLRCLGARAVNCPRTPRISEMAPERPLHTVCGGVRAFAESAVFSCVGGDPERQEAGNGCRRCTQIS
jgi:hypothetical protein